MVAILRHALGENAPVAGKYVLVGHYGEATNHSVWRNEGERLPASIMGVDDVGPFWWVWESEAHEQARVA